MSTRLEDDRDERRNYCSIPEGGEDSEGPGHATDERCTRLVRGFSHGSRWEQCPGFLDGNGRCDWLPESHAPRDDR